MVGLVAARQTLGWKVNIQNSNSRDGKVNAARYRSYYCQLVDVEAFGEDAECEAVFENNANQHLSLF